MAPSRASIWSTGTCLIRSACCSISSSTITRNREVVFAMVAIGKKRNGLTTVFLMHRASPDTGYGGMIGQWTLNWSGSSQQFSRPAEGKSLKLFLHRMRSRGYQWQMEQAELIFAFVSSPLVWADGAKPAPRRIWLLGCHPTSLESGERVAKFGAEYGPNRTSRKP
ncbi:hypothetical protein GGI35DRAFT_265564 [Trichoderma velutinum]